MFHFVLVRMYLLCMYEPKQMFHFFCCVFHLEVYEFKKPASLFAERNH